MGSDVRFRQEPNATATIKYNDSSVQPGLSDAELVRRRRRELGQQDTSYLALGVPPDVADIALRDVTTGRARRARGGSTRSVLGLAFDTAAPLGRDTILT